MYRRAFPILMFTAAIVGCSDRSVPATVPLEAPARLAASAVDESYFQGVTKAIAVAMADPAVRADVRNAMRASLLNQHRLVFHEFVASAEGRRFIAGVAGALGTNETSARRMIARLPDLDFFVPAREDRLTWEATPNYVVVGLLRQPTSAQVAGFKSDGQLHSVNISTRTPGIVIFQFSPPEFRHKRIDPQATGPGSVIQDANDGELAGQFTWTPRNGKPLTVDLADLRSGRVRITSCTTETCLIEDGGGNGGGSTAPSDTTFLDMFEVEFSDGLGCGNPDPSFKATYYLADGSVGGTGQIDYSEVPVDEQQWPHDPLIFRRIREGSTEKINVHVIERDSGWCGGDDDKGNRDFVASDRAQIRTIYKDDVARAHIELDWAPKF